MLTRSNQHTFIAATGSALGTMALTAIGLMYLLAATFPDIPWEIRKEFAMLLSMPMLYATGMGVVAERILRTLQEWAATRRRE
ncbi:hypothetical protein A3A39_00695 [Candidatus Kaiserbacteria bacterium RIFCSPLOWO2_01_FULL_54_13]|uniref:Cation-transporting P-type ATPase C-terminal domain-containing protein n=1 Tax=Candidatus Kaiserbacteria bacterium RIFCSPLOWO2_01_FULL_54_13 TaxID=1798512 RepID=A0A1F6EZX1_9BACT|nr:MAG: hypothetical protein A3A39_00695 [Candidatus Kaiserbacteria bacterium RIFCSPLOWO2_01_FULL_54_13]